MLDNKSAIERPAWIFNLLKRMQVHQARLKSKYTFQTHPFVSNVLVQFRLLVNPNQSESGYPCRMDLSGSTDMVLDGNFWGKACASMVSSSFQASAVDSAPSF